MPNSSNFYAAGLTNFGYQFPAGLKNCGSAKCERKVENTPCGTQTSS